MGKQALRLRQHAVKDGQENVHSTKLRIRPFYKAGYIRPFEKAKHIDMCPLLRPK